MSKGREISVFLRDDDIDIVEDTLFTLLEVCDAHEVPVSLAVIPGRLTSECAALLRDRRRQRPESIEIHQHGWMHVNHETAGKKCEFGSSRTFREQRADIGAGKVRMDQAFGNDWFPAFTPPWNRYTAATRQALAELGFAVLSTDESAEPADQVFREVPVTLDIFRWKNGPALRPQEELIQELHRQIECQPEVGILLHHKVMDRAAFSLLEYLLRDARDSGVTRFQTLQTIGAVENAEMGTHG